MKLQHRLHTRIPPRYIFCMQGLTYPASLVNLPTVIETHKAIDETEATYLKSADIGQMLIV